MARTGGLRSSPPTRPRRPRAGPWPALTVGVLCAHLGLLWLVSALDRPGSAGARPGVVTVARSSAVTLPRAATAREEGATTAETTGTGPADRPATDAATAMPAAPPVPEAPRASAPVSSPPSGAGNDDYLPRSALTQVPRVRSEVLLEYPPGAPAGRFRAKVTLFVDEAGTVRRMRFETPDAEFPPVFQEEVRQRFGAATISPGEVDGRPVKAQHVIVVDFDAGIDEDASNRPAR